MRTRRGLGSLVAGLCCVVAMGCSDPDPAAGLSGGEVPPCGAERDCGEGDVCQAGVCVPVDDGAQAETGDPLPHDDSRPSCSPYDVQCPAPGKCDAHGDCDAGELCLDDGSCAPVPPLPACDAEAYPALTSSALGLLDPIEIDALGIAEIDGASALFVSRNDRVRWVDPQQGLETDPEHVMPDDGVLFNVVVADLDDDGTPELLGAVAGVGVVTIPAPAELTTPAIVADLPTIDSLVALDYDGDGRQDLAVGTAEGAQVLLGGSKTPLTSIRLTDDPVVHLLSGRAVGMRPPGGGPDGVAVSTSAGVQLWAAHPDGDGQPDLVVLERFGQAAWNPLSADLGRPGHTAVGYGGIGGTWTMLRTRADEGAIRDNAVLAWHLVGARGDLDGDGLDDLVLANLDRLFWLPGTEDGTFPCAVEHSIDLPYWGDLAIGDLDGDGRVEVALADGTDVVSVGLAS